MERKPKVTVVLPAYNAEKTLEKTISDIPKGSYDSIILVDDASTDHTVDLAEKLKLDVFVHKRNKGYGANQKTCYTNALEKGADIVVMLHPDYQYDPKLIPYMTGLINEGICDIVLANRIRTRNEALSGGMPLYKYIFNRLLTFIENLFLGLNLGEYHTGYRAFSKKALKSVPYLNNSDDFVFDQQILIQSAFFNLKIGEIPVPAKYFSEASSINFSRSAKYGIETLINVLKYLICKCGILTFKIFEKPKHENQN